MGKHRLTSRTSRREFLKKAGIGSAALTIYCDLPGPGRVSGGDEGFVLTVDGKIFKQMTPTVGASLFTFGAPS